MRKLILVLCGLAVITTARAEDVAERTSCKDINARIEELKGIADLSDEETAELADLRAQHRRDCVARASGRGARTIAKTRVPVAEKKETSEKTDSASSQPDEEEIVIAEKCTNPDSNGCCPGEDFEDMGADGKYCCKGDMCFPPMSVEPQKTEAEKAAEIAANIEKGLCGDGSKPNKYGCCADEIFKDMGDAGFNCCPKSGGDCYPPIK